jgi:hypothetical protein
MYEVGLLETGDSEPSGAGIDGELSVSDKGITEEMMAKLADFVLNEADDNKQIREFGEILDIDMKETRTPIWELSEKEGQEIADIFETGLKELICTEDAPNWDIKVKHTPEIPGIKHTTSFHVNIKHPKQEDEIYVYEIYYCADSDSDSSGVTTKTKKPVDTSNRVRIDRQRGRVLEVMSRVPELTGLYAGDPAGSVNCIILEEVLD